MGLTKQYLKYNAASQFAVIGSSRCNVEYVSMRGQHCRYIASAACEDVTIWDIKTQQKTIVLQGEEHEVTCLAVSPNNENIAVGYTNGSINVYSVISGEVNITFAGHKSPVSCLEYDKAGMKLASGSHDTEIVVWDLVNESGLFRLKGHKGIVTCLQFIKEKNILVSSSKDTFIKWWDLDTQHCFRTMVGHRAEVWSFLLYKNDSRLITGSSDSELRVWSVNYIDEKETGTSKVINLQEEEGVEIVERQVSCKKLGSIMRKARDRVVGMKLSPKGTHLVCHGNSKLVEILQLHTEEEIEIKLKKKLKRARKKKRKEQETAAEEDITEEDLDEVTVERQLEDEITHAGTFSCTGKPCSVDIGQASGHNSNDDTSVVCLLRNNQIETYDGSATNEHNQVEFARGKTIASQGHRGECRSACFSSDALALVTTSAESTKLWSRNTQQCLRTLPCVQATCCLMVPGDLQMVLGTNSGTLEIYHTGSGAHLESVMAHRGKVNCHDLFASKQGLVSGGSDKSVKFWEFDLIKDEEYSQSLKRLTLTHTRTLELDDEVLDVCFSPNNKLIAVSLLDSSVKIFYVDTLKFFLSLYGHSLPASSISISSDSTLIATGSADRNIKIWGLDFGDCHKSIFAHDDDVTCVKFIPDTHMLFSCSKDGLVKQWDADKFILIQVLKGHLGSVWSIAVSSEGNHLVSCGKDFSLRLWQKSQEILLPDEEREMEREKEDEKLLTKNLEPVIADEPEDTETGLASKTTIQGIKAAERMMEAIELYREETAKEKEFKLANNKDTYVSQHPILRAYGNITASKYVMQVIKKVKSSELEESLLVMPFHYTADILCILNEFVKERRDVELSCRCIFFLLKIHHGRITSNEMMVDVIDELRSNAKDAVNQLKDTIGFNLVALEHIKSHLEAREEISIFGDVTEKYKEKSKKKRKREKFTRAVLAV